MNYKKLVVVGVSLAAAVDTVAVLLAQQPQPSATAPPPQAQQSPVNEPAAVTPPSTAEIQAVIDEVLLAEAAREYQLLVDSVEELRGRVADEEPQQREHVLSVPWRRYIDLIEHLVLTAGDAPEAAQKREIAGYRPSTMSTACTVTPRTSKPTSSGRTTTTFARRPQSRTRWKSRVKA